MTRLTRTATGYATADGRWTVEPCIMDDSPRSKGHRAWHLTDTTGVVKFRTRGGFSRVTVDRLYEARDIIDYYQERS